MDKSVNDLKKENNKLREQNIKLTQYVESLAIYVPVLETSTQTNASKLDQIEGQSYQSRRQNLKFFEIEKSDKETWEQTEVKVRNYLSTELNMDESNLSIERAHRLPGNTNHVPSLSSFLFTRTRIVSLSVTAKSVSLPEKHVLMTT